MYRSITFNSKLNEHRRAFIYVLRRFRKLKSPRTNIHSHKDHSGTAYHDHRETSGIPLETSSTSEYHSKLLWTIHLTLPRVQNSS